jgi:predicted XRE-type DNA-binding protein
MNNPAISQPEVITNNTGITPDNNELLNINDLRKKLISGINDIIKANEWKQGAAAKALQVTQPRISNLKNNQFEKFSLDILVDILSKLGHKFKFSVLENDGYYDQLLTIKDHSIREQGILIINQHIEQQKWRQSDASKALKVSQPRISNLRNIRQEKFSLETIIQILMNIGYQLNLQHRLDEESIFTLMLSK